MSKSVRIRTTPNGNDSYLKVKVEQDFDFIEILSLKISQAEAYTRFCSDYGVVVGRVTVNDGFGIPNAKVSIFIPLTDEDSENSEISGLYPFKNIDDKDSNNIRYNLLQNNNNPDNTCFTPVGTFPTKREIIDNDSRLDIYCKYYKYTTTTNQAGDFMLFGVPIGSHILNVDVDLSDIGIASQRPYDFISQGENEKKFESSTKFKSGKDLNKLLQIKSFKKGVNVQPFWGDTDQCDIGISRLDIDVNHTITPSAIFIGSFFSDSEKNSINKNCRPRKDLGRLCETEASEGTVEMIRKTIDGKIERYDVEGGRVVNADGSWAYQVPMNLDYMITDEFGNLIPSEDPNKGLPTRASVRFRIGKDVSGSEGRLRTTAKYLVPHNPPDKTKIDYNFDENTSDEHFRNFYWNKIYTVSNYIPRIQPTCNGDSCADNRHMTGIKDVDDCIGDKVPFPYNRVDTDFNPLFFIICIILSIITFIVWMINSVVISIMNRIIKIINGILKTICDIVYKFSKKICGFIKKLTVGDFDEDGCKSAGCIGSYSGGDCECNNIIDYIPCVVLECDDNYAPGCNCSDSTALNASAGDTNTDGVDPECLGCWAATTKPNDPRLISHWSTINPKSTNGSCIHDGHNVIGAGVTDCYAIKLAEALNMFELDFYNDWINGTLYTYLLKYKKRKNGKQKFCDIDCDSSESDNRCDKSFLVDTLVNDGGDRKDVKKTVKHEFHEGFIKQVTSTLPDGSKQETLYYAPYLNDHNFKLFATELVHLGSVFDCDWEGIPKLQPFLIPTSYKRPPYTDEYMDDETTKLTCGMTSTGSNGSSGLFFDIDCIGLTVGIGPFGGPRSNNFKRICEMGVDIDQADLDGNNNVISEADCFINENDINQPYGTLFRNTFYQLNINDGPTKLNSWPIGGLSPNIDTGFGLLPNSILPNEYTQFRGGGGNAYITPNPTNYTQTKNSFYFYFGIIPGSTAVDIMNRKFFTECTIIEKNDFIVSGIITDITTNGCTGAISTTVAGGEAPYTYEWIGPNGYTLTETIGDITNLCAGIYTVKVTDSNGGTSTISFTVNQPSPFSCNVTTNNSIQNGGTGDLFINAFGGVPPYSYSINGGTPISMGSSSFISLQEPAGTYNLTITDSNNLSCSSVGIITEPPLLTLGSLVTWVHTSCGNNNGTITINTPTQANLGGIPPYSFEITGPNSFETQSTSAASLASGTYNISVSDGSPIPQISTQTVTINPSSQSTLTIPQSWYCWSTPQPQPLINAVFNAVFNGGSYTIVATPRDSSNNPTTPVLTQTFTTTPATFVGLNPLRYDFVLTDVLGCTAYAFSDFRPNYGQVPNSPINLVLDNPTDKYCWVDGYNKQIVPKFAVTVDGPFTIVGGGATYSSSGVPNGTIITMPILNVVPPNNIIDFVLTETTHNCSKTLTVDFSSQLSQQLIASASQTINCNCSSIPTNGEVTATINGGWLPTTILWYKDSGSGFASTSITSVTATVTAADCGTIWKAKVTDNIGCYTWTNPITII